MSNKWLTSFGIEMHIEVLSDKKAFSNTKFVFDSKPNTSINQYDMGYPGAKPIVNEDFAKKAFLASSFLGMETVDQLEFDRKHYFYSDLPKGFQITQNFNPLGINGKLELSNGTVIKVNRLHMEEDTAKQVHSGDKTLIDYNRAGNPLIEVVADHTSFNSLEDVRLYIETIRKEFLYMGISDGKMEQGSLRVDANVSVRKEGDDYNTKVEIKNVNSINNLIHALELEVQEQIQKYENNEEVIQSTKRYDDNSKKNILMRKKETKEDYRYMAEPNIAPIIIDNNWKKSVLDKSNNGYSKELSEFLDKYPEISSKDIEEVMNDKDLFVFVKAILENTKEYKTPFNLVKSDILGILKKNNIDVSVLYEFKDELSELFELIESKEITGKIAKQMIPEIILNKKSTSKLLKTMNVKVISNEDELLVIIKSIIDNNKDMIEKDYDSRPERVEKMIMGLMMKQTKGQANPAVAMKLIKTQLTK